MRIAALALCLLCLAGSAFSQTSTTVSATIMDTSGQSWNNGTYEFDFKVAPSNPSAQYFWGGTAFAVPHTIAGNLDGSGHFSVAIPSNTNITPAQSTWTLQVCPIAKGNTPCFTQQGLTITGATQNISSSVIPPAISIDLAHPAYPFVVAYSNTEISTAPVGGLYWDYTLSHYFACQTTNGSQIWYGQCTLWKELCIVGDGLCGGGGSAISIQHNGVLVGTQPIVNLIDGANVTLTVTNNVGLTRIDTTIAASGGGGTGCTLPGINTAVLSEHPAGTCYDSLHWTWDDSTSKQNMQAGLTNLPGFTDSYIFGNGNSATGISTGFIAGDFNSLVSTDANVLAIGLSNGGGQALNINDCYIIGETNRFPGLGHASTYGASVDDCGILGENNSLNFSNTGTSGGNPDDIWLIGSNNTITESGTQTVAIDSVHVLGRQNVIEDILNSIDFVTIAGDRNTVNGAQTTAQILGFDNTLSNVSTGINTSVVGADNTLTNVATTTYATTVGNNTTLSNCDACYIFGQNVHNSTSNTIAIGESIAPEIIVGVGTVNVTAWPVSKEIVFTFCASGCDITGTPCTTGSSSYNSCDTTINFSALGTFVDAKYSAVCNGVGPIDPAHNDGANWGRVTLIGIENTKTTTSLQPITATQGSTAVAWVEIDCHLVHR